jgi:hypothetical protein
MTGKEGKKLTKTDGLCFRMIGPFRSGDMKRRGRKAAKEYW